FNIESINALYITFALLTVFMVAGTIIFSNSTRVIASLLYILATVTMGALLYMLLSVLLVDLFHFVVKLQPKIYGIMVLAISILISVYGVWNATGLKTSEIEVPIKGLSKEVRAMHLTDIHLGHFRGRSFLQKIAEITNRQVVDVVFITGDLFDGKIQLAARNLEPLGQLSVPVYFVEGNHDKYTGVKLIKQMLRETGIRVLENELIDWGELQIIGLNHMHAGEQGATIKAALQSIDTEKDKPTILLHHSPDGIRYANEKGVDLYLAGHTHAGQLFPVNFIAKLLFTYNNGLYDYNGTRIYVSSGAGTFGPPMRVGTKSEITVVKLIPWE
ncbi:metallophosphoesterase, partial [Bacteroidota bacterium]